MLTHEQIVAYLEATLPPAERSGVDAALARDPAAAAQLAEFASYDAALRTLLGGAEERARLEAAMLATLREPSLEPRERAVPPPERNERNPMSSSPENSDSLKPEQVRAEMAAAGVPIVSRSPTKDAQVAKELREESTWGQKPREKNEPDRGAEERGRDNEYDHGLSP